MLFCVKESPPEKSPILTVRTGVEQESRSYQCFDTESRICRGS